MRIFYDTEFTELRPTAELISAGFVSEVGQTFYAEITDWNRERVSDFVRETVIPLLGGKPENAMNKGDFVTNLIRWLRTVGSDLILLSDSTWDIFHGVNGTEPLENRLVERICQCLFEHSYRDPDTGEVKRSKRDIGIPQGPVLSAWIGTITMFPVDEAAYDLMQRHVRSDTSGKSLPRIGYARYVDDIVLLADSENLLSTLRQVRLSGAPTIPPSASHLT